MKKILAYTEEIRSCDCCGKSELKGTWAIESDGNIYYFGSICVHKHGITLKEKKDFINHEKEHKRKEKMDLFMNRLSQLDFSEFQLEEKY